MATATLHSEVRSLRSALGLPLGLAAPDQAFAFPPLPAWTPTDRPDVLMGDYDDDDEDDDFFDDDADAGGDDDFEEDDDFLDDEEDESLDEGEESDDDDDDL